ncbi:MAG: HAD-IA family hydrolase [Geminocystis sp.]|nr:HAD-IA family hydrolase [Geminocystis sp.]
MRRPKVIFLDAVGTLFGVKNSVGCAYAKIASKYGVQADGKIIDSCFYRAFSQSPPLAFSEADEVEKKEYNWWKNIAFNTFKMAESLQQFSNFDLFFEELYQYFKTAEPWEVYEDVVPSLNRWKNQGISLGIISNFDSRIFPVLESLKLRDYFDSITISSLTGYAKPHPKIFLTALAKNNCKPEEAWHIGDSEKEDYQAAKEVGIQSFWLNRPIYTLKHLPDPLQCP